MKDVNNRGREGLTLIELMVVITIIGILAALLFPALSKVKTRAQETYCLNNLKQMYLAWHQYTEDYRGFFPVNTSGRDAGTTLDSPSWVAGYMSVGSSPDNTNANMLIGSEYQKFGSLGGYAKTASIYHCPSDISRDRTNALPRVRSISMNGWINPGRNGVVSGRFVNLDFQKFLGMQDYSRLAPSDLFVFLDERPESINDGWFMVDMESYNPTNLAGLKVRDLPAVYHNNASAFSFADGHAEFHKWKDSRTLTLKFVRNGNPTPDNQDILWLMEHATRPRKQVASETTEP